MPLITDEQGNPIWVPDGAAGAPAPAPAPLTGQRVAMVDDVGQVRELDLAEVDLARAAGWRSETPEEFRARELETKYGDIASQLETAGEGVLRGFTGLASGALGLVGSATGMDLPNISSDAAIPYALEVLGSPEAAEKYRRTAPERIEANPAVSFGGELAGSLVPGAGFGLGALRLPGKLARPGAGIIESGARYGTGLAVEGAVGGALAGAGQVMSEAALAPNGDYDNLAQRLIAGAKHGAGFGAVTGGFLGFTGSVGLKTIERGAEKLAGPGGLKRLLETTSDAATGRALGMPRAPFGPQAGTEERIKTMVRSVKKATLDDGSQVMRLGDKQEVLAERVALAEKQYAKKIGNVAREVDDAIETAAAKSGYREGARALRPDLDGFFAKVDSMVAEASTGPAALAGQMRRAAKQLDKLRQTHLSGEATLGDVLKYRRKLDELIYPKKAGSGVTVAKANAAELNTMSRELEGVVEGTIARADDLVPGASERYKEAKEMFGALKDARQISSAEVRRGMGRNRLSPIETLSTVGGTVASLATGNALPVIGGAAIGLVRNQWRARGEQALAIIAERAAKSDMQLTASVGRYFKRAADVRRGTVGAFSAREVEDDERKGRVERVLRQKKNETRADAYHRTLNRISRYNPEQEPDMPALASAAPQTAIATAARMARAREYLIKTAPSDVMGDDPLQPQLKKQLADPVRLEQWSRRLEAVEDPMGVIQRGLDHGTLTREHVETIKQVDPQLYESLREKVMDQLTTSKEQLPYQQRIRLGVLLGLPTDKSLRPSQIARTQLMYQKARAAQPQAGGAAPAPQAAQPGASSYATEAQRLEAGIPPQ